MLSTLIHDHRLSSISILGWITLKSLAAWLVTVLPAAVITYGIVMSQVEGRELQEKERKSAT